MIDWVGEPGTICLANINSSLSGEIYMLVDDDKLPRDSDVLGMMQACHCRDGAFTENQRGAIARTDGVLLRRPFQCRECAEP
jgi:hypothetical protein